MDIQIHVVLAQHVPLCHGALTLAALPKWTTKPAEFDSVFLLLLNVVVA